MPANAVLGNYQVLLNLPDPYLSIHDRPEYSIRLANKEVWEEKTGYNSLLANIQITSPLGNNAKVENNTIPLHPSPAKTDLCLTGNIEENAKYEITSIDGKVMQTGALSGCSISIESLKTGFYFIKIKAKEGESVQRFVKE